MSAVNLHKTQGFVFDSRITAYQDLGVFDVGRFALRD